MVSLYRRSSKGTTGREEYAPALVSTSADGMGGGGGGTNGGGDSSSSSSSGDWLRVAGAADGTSGSWVGVEEDDSSSNSKHSSTFSKVGYIIEVLTKLT